MQTVGRRAFLGEQIACERVLRLVCGQSQEKEEGGGVQGRQVEVGNHVKCV